MRSAQTRGPVFTVSVPLKHYSACWRDIVVGVLGTHSISKFLASAVVKDREVALELDIPVVTLRFGAVKLQIILS